MAISDPVEHASACPLDCPDACSLTVTVLDGRVRSLEGSSTNRVTGGFICGKVRHFAEHVYGADRVLRPAVRTGPKGTGQYREVSWDEALSLVARQLAEHRARFGGESILPLHYGGSNGYLTQGAVDARLFRRLGSSRLARTPSAAPSSTAAAGLYGKMPGVSYEDYPAAQLIVIWGANPSASGIHLLPYLNQARKRGARLVVIDPRRTPLATQADVHLAVAPGADVPLALAVHRWLFTQGRADRDFLSRHAQGVQEFARRADRWTLEAAAEATRVPAEQIATLAQWYADADPAVIRCGWGLERNRNGGSAVAAVLALPAVAGKFGKPGGGYTMSNSPAWDLDPGLAACEAEPATRIINMNQVGQALLSAEPAVRLVFVYNANPVATLPAQTKVRQGFHREDLFTVVFEQVWTDTARLADVVLPATTFLEHQELSKGYGALVLQAAEPVIPPVGEARPNYPVFAELLRRLDLHRPGDPETAEEILEVMLAGSRSGQRLGAELARGGPAAPACGTRPVQFVDVFPATASGKIELVPAALDAVCPGGCYAFDNSPRPGDGPLTLLSPASGRTISSSLAQLVPGIVPVEMHPEDAAARGLADGAAVRVFNRWGEVVTLLRVNDELPRGVAQLPKGLWARHTLNGATANAVAPDDLTDLGGGACFNDARVEIELAQGATYSAMAR